VTDSIELDEKGGTAVPQKATRREWLGLTVLMLPTLLLAMDISVLHLAVPS
jgi:DHA2 family multidrug resistance protein-like MFS transporter